MDADDKTICGNFNLFKLPSKKDYVFWEQIQALMSRHILMMVLLYYSHIYIFFFCFSAPAEVVDLVIALDGSATLKQHGFDKIQELAKKLLKRFKISKPATHVGLMEFSNDVTPVLPLNELYDLNEVNKVIDKIKPSGGEGTATDDVLKKAANQMFTVPAGGRADGQGVGDNHRQ